MAVIRCDEAKKMQVNTLCVGGKEKMAPAFDMRGVKRLAKMLMTELVQANEVI